MSRFLSRFRTGDVVSGRWDPFSLISGCISVSDLAVGIGRVERSGSGGSVGGG